MAESRDITVNVRVEGLEKLTEALEALRTVQIDGEKIAEVLNRAAGRASRPRRLHEPLSEETGA